MQVPNNIAEEVIEERKRRVSCKLEDYDKKIRIKLKSYDHNLVDKSSEKIVRAVKLLVQL